MKCRRPEFQQYILDVAKEMILETGVRGLNMKELAREAEIAKATLYKVIKTKENLVQDIAYDFLFESRLRALDWLFHKDNFTVHRNIISEKLVNLGLGKMRILIKEIYKEYPRIEEINKKYWDEYKLKIKDQFEEMQKQKSIRADINLEVIIDFTKRTFDNYTLSEAPDSQVKKELIQIFQIITDGICYRP